MQRELEFHPADGGPPRRVVVSFSVPAPSDSSGEEWRCRLEIAGLRETPHVQDFPGVDALQALLSAIRIVPLLLRLDARGGRLTWLGSEDLGFPHGQDD